MALRATGRGQHGTRGNAALRSAFVVLQIGFALLLTAVATNMVESLSRLQRVELGYRPDSVIIARVALPPERFRTSADLARFSRDFEHALSSTPGVIGAGAVSVAPLTGVLAAVPFTVPGREADARDRPIANYRGVSTGYLATIGATLVSGRLFDASDDENGARVAIVSRAFAERFLSGEDAVGRQVLVTDNSDGPRPLTIVGVIENMRHVDLVGQPTHDIFYPMAQAHQNWVGFLAASHYWTIRISSDAASHAQTFARTLERFDRDIALARVRPMRLLVDDALASREFSVSALVAFAVTALALAALGVYSVMAYSVAQRRRELGLRHALGATKTQVMEAVMRPALAAAAIGVVLGLGGALFARRAIAGLLFGVSSAQPAVLGGVALLLLVTCALAAAIPAWRASRIDPMVALAGD